ncbi:histidine phosphatase family protein [Adlercreutzia faecimuris]|uniref:Phosphoglycerate mutase family protein n=1 Tax=Adlercreutzia faecimuris TaxID=2897341 RepID=A0ABS9WK84_9ACTN|nr:histidine phosphatase family protein [Adlercreutzia sp. JBNU-10]MCI2242806.1 phosphoglycerate mutase family protein [Adlercreutzia sp. JBNU-10]
MTVTFHFARHGETLFNVMGKVQGWCDTPLTGNGLYAAYRLGQGLVGTDFIWAYSSDSGRARETLAVALEARANERRLRGIDEGDRSIPVSADLRLREWCYGWLEGELGEEMRRALVDCFGRDLERAEQNERLPEIADFFARADPTGRAEDFAAIEGRLRSFIAEAAAHAEEAGGGDVLVVTHAFIIRTLVYLFDRARINDPLKIENASLTELIWQDGEICLGKIGDTAHLA